MQTSVFVSDGPGTQGAVGSTSVFLVAEVALCEDEAAHVGRLDDSAGEATLPGPALLGPGAHCLFFCMGLSESTSSLRRDTT